MYIWTRGYNPWVLGGDVHAPIRTEVEATGPYEGGKDYQLYLVVSPSGKTFVVEGETGAIVGENLATVQEDIYTGDPEVMRKQIAEARITVLKAVTLSPDEFWARLRRSR